jgi:gamma-glutamyltranspeptidase
MLRVGIRPAGAAGPRQAETAGVRCVVAGLGEREVELAVPERDAGKVAVGRDCLLEVDPLAGTGIWLNNSMQYCAFEPKRNPMDALPGRRKLAGFCPMLVMHEGKPWIALGSPGGHTILQTVPQMVMNMIDFRLDIHQVIAAPRLSFVEPDIITVDEGVPESFRKERTKLGHNVQVRRLGNAHGLTVDYDK